MFIQWGVIYTEVFVILIVKVINVGSLLLVEEKHFRFSVFVKR